MFVTLTTGVDFINILHAHFSYESALRNINLVTFWRCIFWHKNIGKKGAGKMLMKLTPGVSFTNTLVQFANTQHMAS